MKVVDLPLLLQKQVGGGEVVNTVFVDQGPGPKADDARTYATYVVLGVKFGRTNVCAVPLYTLNATITISHRIDRTVRKNLALTE